MIRQSISHYAPKAHPSPTDGWRAPQADKILEKLGEGGISQNFPQVPIFSGRVDEVLRIPACLCGASGAGRPISSVGSWKRRVK